MKRLGHRTLSRGTVRGIGTASVKAVGGLRWSDKVNVRE